MALMRWTIDLLHAKGFTLMTVPHMSRANALYGSSQFATPEDAARYAALGQIASDNFQLPIDATQAGTAGTGRITADTGKVQQAVEQRHQAADKQTGTILDAGKNILQQNSNLIDPQARTQATMTALEPLLNQFESTYGFRPQITPEMLWGQAVDYNNPTSPPPIVNAPNPGGKI